MPLAEALYNSIISNATGTQMKHFSQNSRGAVPEKLNWFSFLVKEQLKKRKPKQQGCCKIILSFFFVKLGLHTNYKELAGISISAFKRTFQETSIPHKNFKNSTNKIQPAWSYFQRVNTAINSIFVILEK